MRYEIHLLGAGSFLTVPAFFVSQETWMYLHFRVGEIYFYWMKPWLVTMPAIQYAWKIMTSTRDFRNPWTVGIPSVSRAW